MSAKWTKARKAKFQATVAAKKAAFDNPSPMVEQTQRSSVDIDRMCEFHYRRGLIAAMECIIRELR